MPIESAGDRAVFFGDSDTAVYTPGGGVPSAPIAGIFDGPTQPFDLNEAATLDERPSFCCAESDLPDGADPENGDELEVTGRGVYRVVALIPDGQGMVLIRLGADS